MPLKPIIWHILTAKWSMPTEKWLVNIFLRWHMTLPLHKTFEKHLQHLKQWYFLRILHVFHKTNNMCCGASHTLSLDTKLTSPLLAIWVQPPLKNNPSSYRFLMFLPYLLDLACESIQFKFATYTNLTF